MAPPYIFRLQVYAYILHQQHLAKNPSGYCGLGGCGVPFESAELDVGEKA
jgi:peptide methionine sulfoxide reductase MsrA